MSARDTLRTLTRDAHDRVDALFSAFDLSDRASYWQFLAAQASVFVPIEQALTEHGADHLFPGWAERLRSPLIVADLMDLGIRIETPIDPPDFGAPESVAGGAYVLEGSRLGGAVLRKAVGADFPRRFLDASMSGAEWRKFIAQIERILISDVQMQVAGQAAIETFACFETAAAAWEHPR